MQRASHNICRHAHISLKCNQNVRGSRLWQRTQTRHGIPCVEQECCHPRFALGRFVSSRTLVITAIMVGRMSARCTFSCWAWLSGSVSCNCCWSQEAPSASVKHSNSSFHPRFPHKWQGIYVTQAVTLNQWSTVPTTEREMETKCLTVRRRKRWKSLGEYLFLQDPKQI